MRIYLLLRLKVLGRQLAELGWLRLLLLVPMVLAALRQALLLLGKRPVGQWLLPFVGAGICLSIHRQRRDLAFLQGAAPDFRRWLLAEYVLWQLPIYAVLLVHSAWLPALLALGLLPLITHKAVSQVVQASRKKSSLLGSETFEWVSGYRKMGAWFLWAIGLAVAIWQRHNAVVALISIVWGLIIASFYTTPEDPVMLLQYPLRATAFLRRKLVLALRTYLLSSVPFIVLMGTGAVTWGGALAVVLWSSVVLVLVVLAKYAFYPHAAPVQAGVVSLAMLVGVNSVYVVLLAAAGVGLLWKSRRHLLQYRWHD